jgi:L-asparaginase
MRKKTIVILGTGGTIAGRAASATDSIGYTAAEVGIETLVAAIPALESEGPVQAEQLAQIDSKDMSFEVWRQLAVRVNHFLAQDDVQGIVITHGTDTIEETAFFLHCVCRPRKPVVLTCAMRPATALQADGPQNVLDAVKTARWSGATGVVVVCAGKVHGAVDVQKAHTYRLDAFDSGDAGPIAYIEEKDLRMMRNWPLAGDLYAPAAPEIIAKSTATLAWPRVEIVMNHAGAGGAIVEALRLQGVSGLVVAATGNGTVHHELEAALLEAQAAGIQVVRATRCASGRILPRPGDRLPESGGLNPPKARIALMLDLMSKEQARQTRG